MSSKRRHLQVEVMEPVRGLSIQDSPAAIPAGEKKLFVANIQTGKPVHFLWTFDRHHLYKTTCIGKEVRSPRARLWIQVQLSCSLSHIHGDML